MTADHRESKEDRRAVLFPHTYLPGSAWKEVLSYFQSITLCLPWGVEPGSPVEESHGQVRIIRPPSSLRPPADFRKLLSEYRQWVAENRGVFPLALGDGEVSTWEIRRALRQPGKDLRDSVEENAFLWHMALHLERELENDRGLADEMIFRLKDSPSPLRDALGGDDPGHGVIDDLPVSGPLPALEERHLGLVLKAWAGLFGGSLREGDDLLTLRPEVLSYLAELFHISLPDPPLRDGEPRFQKIDLPLSKTNRPTAEDPVLNGLSGRTVLLMACD